MTKSSTYNSLIFLSLVSFGFFGSLSHIFTAALILLIFTNINYSLNYRAMLLFLAVTGCFFLFLINSMFRTDFIDSIYSMSPMLPIPLIALMIIFKKKDFKISAKQIAEYSQFAVFFSFLIYLFLVTFFGPDSIFYKFHSGRLNLFSGNPIPFSFAIFGISIFLSR